MKSQNGITLASLTIYVIAMVIVVATIATITNYFYGNINDLSTKTDASKEYMSFSSYFVNEVNNKENAVIKVSEDNSEIIFSSGNQFKYVKKNDSSSGIVYYNKTIICKDVKTCQFSFNKDNNTVGVTMNISGKAFNNVYTLQNIIY